MPDAQWWRDIADGALRGYALWCISLAIYLSIEAVCGADWSK